MDRLRRVAAAVTGAGLPGAEEPGLVLGPFLRMPLSQHRREGAAGQFPPGHWDGPQFNPRLWKPLVGRPNT